MHLNVSSEKWRPFCVDLNVLNSLNNTLDNRYGLYSKENLMHSNGTKFYKNNKSNICADN